MDGPIRVPSKVVFGSEGELSSDGRRPSTDYCPSACARRALRDLTGKTYRYRAVYTRVVKMKHMAGESLSVESPIHSFTTLTVPNQQSPSV